MVHVNEDVTWLEKMEKTFTQIAGEDKKIDFDEFKRALNIKESFFAERFFQLFDQDDSGTIELQELLDGLRMLTGADAARKLEFLFDVYDVDGNGSIDKYELLTVLQSSVHESSLSVSDTDLELLTDVLFESADSDGSGSISFDELKEELEKHPGLLENLTIGAAQWLKPRTTEMKEKGTYRYLTIKYWRNNSKKGVLFLLYFLVNIGLFVLGCYNYRTSNGFVIVARGCGMALNFNCSFILVCMLRRCITFIRSFKQSQFLPLDQHILLHKVVGMVIGLLSLIHSLAHVGNAALVSRHLNLTVPEFLITTKAQLGWVYGLAPLSGVILNAILIVIIICSLPFIRRSGKFQVFYWTHILYIPFWLLIIIHANNFWIWFVIPGVIFLVEKISRSKILKLAAYGETHIVEVNLLPSKVTHLVISKPPKWRYRPGDYVFIQVPDIARNEWHPFTISSAPELQGFFWLHVRSAGHWTNKLYEYFEEYNPVVELAGVYNKGFSESLHNMETGMEHGKYRKCSNVRRVVK
ncbi:NADPH oxidase 5 [Patella vulgata]|uniref:NADPH oxidase 5 n=1 Tax=Patella vulgata TaxID=6465 RepID=UPI0024A82612|nr:NADPH oxidase 5 [Patella vulgata]